MKHLKVKYFNGAEIVHLDGVIQSGDMSLRNSDLIGDAFLGWHEAEATADKVNCVFFAKAYTQLAKK